MRRVVISKAKLANQYETMKVSELVELYDISLARLYQILDDCGIPRKRVGAPRRETASVVIKD